MPEKMSACLETGNGQHVNSTLDLNGRCVSRVWNPQVSTTQNVTVFVWNNYDEGQKLAFCFETLDKPYILKVNDGELEMAPFTADLADPKDPALQRDDILFRWERTRLDNWAWIRSVLFPDLRLCVQGGRLTLGVDMAKFEKFRLTNVSTEKQKQG